MVTHLLSDNQFRWSTSDVAPEHALSYWIDTIGHSMLEMNIDSTDREHFSATLEQAPLGPASLNLVQARRQQIHRTRAAIARSRFSVFFLLQPRMGSFRIEQSGREIDLQVGQCVVLDGSEPYRMVCPQETRCLALRFPHEWLKSWLPAPEDLVARRLDLANGWGQALSSALSALDIDSCVHLPLPPSVVAEQLAALLALAAGNSARARPERHTLFDRLTQSIRDRCHESDLTPDVLAREHGVSKRHVHYVFARNGKTFGDELIDTRLKRAQQLLADRRFVDISIGEIAARCGFIEPSHFARRFRQKFGLGPTQFRKSATLAD